MKINHKRSGIFYAIRKIYFKLFSNTISIPSTQVFIHKVILYAFSSIKDT